MSEKPIQEIETSNQVLTDIELQSTPLSSGSSGDVELSEVACDPDGDPFLNPDALPPNLSGTFDAVFGEHKAANDAYYELHQRQMGL